jgi:hypothetical protein
VDSHEATTGPNLPFQPQAQHSMSYILRCASCLVEAHVTLELVVPVTGALRCLSCNESRVVVTEFATTIKLKEK